MLKINCDSIRWRPFDLGEFDFFETGEKRGKNGENNRQSKRVARWKTDPVALFRARFSSSCAGRSVQETRTTHRFKVNKCDHFTSIIHSVSQSLTRSHSFVSHSDVSSRKLAQPYSGQPIDSQEFHVINNSIVGAVALCVRLRDI